MIDSGAIVVIYRQDLHNILHVYWYEMWDKWTCTFYLYIYIYVLNFL